ncbi:MAG TPA: hypothetical protein PK177_04765 [Burkholderiaceae bacterium]|nr:hypothetical protein [Burkholderiaceae bacterium]
MLRRSAALLPTIVTLYSGAAAAGARSSNALRLADAPTKDGRGYLCLDESSGTRHGNSVDLGGSRPEAKITRISERRYYRHDSNRPVSIDEMCKQGGEFRYQESGNARSSLDGGFVEGEFSEGEFAEAQFVGDELTTGGEFATNELADASGFEMQGKGGGGGGGGPGGGGKGWKKVRVERGGFCSTAALLSFSKRGSIKIRDI